MEQICLVHPMQPSPHDDGPRSRGWDSRMRENLTSSMPPHESISKIRTPS